jgi:hypothetical protein
MIFASCVCALGLVVKSSLPMRWPRVRFPKGAATFSRAGSQLAFVHLSVQFLQSSIISTSFFTASQVIIVIKSGCSERVRCDFTTFQSYKLLLLCPTTSCQATNSSSSRSATRKSSSIIKPSKRAKNFSR